MIEVLTKHMINKLDTFSSIITQYLQAKNIYIYVCSYYMFICVWSLIQSIVNKFDIGIYESHKFTLHLIFKKIFGVPFFVSENGFLLVKSVYVLFIEDLGFSLLEKIASTSLVIAFELNTVCYSNIYCAHSVSCFQCSR